MKYLYVLKLECSKWYVGITECIDRRLKQHKLGLGARWTCKYPVIEMVSLEPISDTTTSKQAERRKVLELMTQYGINNVRGGGYTFTGDYKFTVPPVNPEPQQQCADPSDFVLKFGKYKDKTLQDMMSLDQGYILWLAGIHMTAAFHVKSQAAYDFISQNHPDAIEASKMFLKDRCKRCLMISKDSQPCCQACKHYIEGK